MLAVQAENPSQSAWAVASRTTDPRPDDLAALLGDGRVIRTHVLRPTWHYVAADDIGWLVELTAPRVLRTVDQLLVKQRGYGDVEFDRAAADVLDVLGDRHLTRPEVDAGLRDRGYDLDGHALMLLLAHLELSLHLCSGAPADGVHTYAAMRERVPSPRRLDREAALAELALRYFTGHGPATVRDLAYWATLTLTDVRAGLAAVADRLESFDHDGRTYWHAPGEEPPVGRAGARRPPAADPRRELPRLPGQPHGPRRRRERAARSPGERRSAWRSSTAQMAAAMKRMRERQQGRLRAALVPVS